MSLLPSTILPESTPIGRVRQNGEVSIDHNWWLLLYNICLNALGTANSLSPDALQGIANTDTDIADTDAISLQQAIANLQKQVIQPEDVVVSASELPAIARALLLAQDPLLPDAIAAAQPVSAIAPTGSPFAYVAPFAGSVAITGGSVSGVVLLRQGTSVPTGLTTGLFPVSRGDTLTISYGSAPTLTFIPGSSQ